MFMSHYAGDPHKLLVQFNDIGNPRFTSVSLLYVGLGFGMTIESHKKDDPTEENYSHRNFGAEGEC